MLRLIAAIDGWDPHKGASFEQYCWTRVSGAIQDEPRRIDWAPRSVRRDSRLIDRARDRVQLREGRLPTETEIAREAEMTVGQLRASVDRVHRAQLISLSVIVDPSGEDPVELGETVADPALDAEPAARAISRERIALLTEAVRALPSRERAVVELACFADASGIEVAGRLGVSESRVSQLLGSARARLRGPAFD
jgi:RNA polymerase sigma factor for flagellar operon FliA